MLLFVSAGFGKKLVWCIRSYFLAFSLVSTVSLQKRTQCVLQTIEEFEGVPSSDNQLQLLSSAAESVRQQATNAIADLENEVSQNDVQRHLDVRYVCALWFCNHNFFVSR